MQKLERLRSICGRGEKAIFWNYNHEKRQGGGLHQHEVRDIQREGRKGRGEKVNDVKESCVEMSSCSGKIQAMIDMVEFRQIKSW